MTPKIITVKETSLVGLHLKMNLIENKTAELWQQFSPRISKIKDKCSSDRYSLQIYPEAYFHHFNPNTKFIKWAAVEVSDIDYIPSDMETLTISGGLYAVFHYKGSSADQSIFQYIYGQWIPNSSYMIDNRPHFEVLGENYKTNDPNAEEDIYIPIKSKTDK